MVYNLPPHLGSPPHTRGKSALPSRQRLKGRITPAYAGKICGRRCRMSAWSDHPRIRGENASTSSVLLLMEGSPPHTRGKSVPSMAMTRVKRITPAYAGKILEILYPNRKVSGSPPHTRGKLRAEKGQKGVPGITPAYAGKILDLVQDATVP